MHVWYFWLSKFLYCSVHYLCLKRYGVMHEARGLFVSAVAYTNEWLCSCNLVSIPLGISVVPIYIPLDRYSAWTFSLLLILFCHCLNFLIASYFLISILPLGVADEKFDYKMLYQFPPGCHWLICFGNGYGQKWRPSCWTAWKRGQKAIVWCVLHFL